MTALRTDLSATGLLPIEAELLAAEPRRFVYEPMAWLRFVIWSLAAMAGLALLLSLGGCAGKAFELDKKYSPLERIRESSLPGVPADGVSTIFSEVLTRDLGAFLAACPPGTVEFDALMRHERVHSVHEFADPTLLARYALSAGFRWQEEKAGWAEEFRVLRAAGRTIDVDACAKFLSSDFYKGMVTYEDAKAWVESQIR